MIENNESIQELKALVEERQQLITQKEATENQIREIERRMQKIAVYAQAILDICGELKSPEMHPIFRESLPKDVLSIRTYNLLVNANLNTIGGVVRKTEVEFLRIKNCGKKSKTEIQKIFGGYGLRLGMTEEAMLKWIPPAPEKSSFSH